MDNDLSLRGRGEIRSTVTAMIRSASSGIVAIAVIKKMWVFMITVAPALVGWVRLLTAAGNPL